MAGGQAGVQDGTAQHHDAQDEDVQGANRRGAVDRRAVLAGAAGVAAVAALSACGSSSSGGTTAAGGGSASGAGSAPATPTTAGTPDDKGGSGGGSGAAGAALVSLSEVPVGGAVSAKGADGKPLVVSQPTAGSVKAFSAKCTHQGCTVAPAGKTFQCPCHGSVFDAATGKNVSGPAPRPLTEVPVKVVDGKVVTA